MLLVLHIAFGLLTTFVLAHAEDRNKQNYSVRCASCHGVDGHGDGSSTRWLRTKPTDFHNCAEMKKLSDETIFAAIKYGTGMLDLPADMPGFLHRLSDAEIRNLSVYVRHFCHE